MSNIPGADLISRHLSGRLSLVRVPRATGRFEAGPMITVSERSLDLVQRDPAGLDRLKFL
jgi:hypothetical protein